MATAYSSAPKEAVTAALLVIGGKILSGRTKDQNIGYIAEYLTAVGIDLNEVRVVGDEERAIVDAINALRRRYTYVFTTGGIGPTHGDITADCVAKAFGVPIDTDPRALAILHEWVQRLRGLAVDPHLKFRRLLNRQAGRIGTFEKFIDINCGILIKQRKISRERSQPSVRHRIAIARHVPNAMAGR
jgi:hypothetical protein